MMHSACLVVAGPSGVGKSTLIQAALAQNPRWLFSVSATTREIRPGEQDGREYYFVGQDEFDRRVAAGQFLEYAGVYGKQYGTPLSELERAARSGKNLLIEVDTVGCLSIRAIRPEFPLVAITPPSLMELKRRLRDRGTESEESLAIRFAGIVAELQRMRGFDFLIVNNQVEQAVAQLLSLMSIVEAGMTRVTESIDRLLSEIGGRHEA
jgi:guanylate kinase